MLCNFFFLPWDDFLARYDVQLAKNTTPMYRAPEMLDLYQNYPINEQSDIWVRIIL